MKPIEVTNLSKTYRNGRLSVQALDNVSISASEGEIIGLLGPNGAGKTTLVKLLLSIAYPTSGSALVFGMEAKDYRVKKRIGYLPENHKYPPYLSGGQVLKFFGKLSGMQGKVLETKIDELLEMMKLSPWKKSKVKTYSKGMMQRLGLAQAMLNDPDLIFLDEPTDGVDPLGRKEIRDILLDLKRQNKTVFLNSHLLSEVELISDRVGILHKGKLIKEGSVKEITEKGEEYKITIKEGGIKDLLPELESRFSLYKIENNFINLKTTKIEELNAVIDILRARGKNIVSIEPRKETLENIFIDLIQETDGAIKK